MASLDGSSIREGLSLGKLGVVILWVSVLFNETLVVELREGVPDVVEKEIEREKGSVVVVKLVLLRLPLPRLVIVVIRIHYIPTQVNTLGGLQDRNLKHRIIIIISIGVHRVHHHVSLAISLL